jgi:hypothetical protein
MDPVHVDDDSQRALERHALRNVSWLAAKLGNRDAIDVRSEKIAIRVLGGVALLLVVAMGVSAYVRSPPADAEERMRCELEVRVAAVWQLKKDLKASHPEMSDYDLSLQADRRYRDMKPAAVAECGKSRTR